MQTIILVIHLLIALGLVGVILIQRSEGGALGMGGGSGSGGGFMTGRAGADLLTRTTAFLAASFFVTSMILAILASSETESPSILAPPTESATQPSVPADPAAPIGN